MKPIRDVTAIQYPAEHLTLAINYARLLGRLRKTVSGFRPSRNKARRLKARQRMQCAH
ncbi:hypothetical protein [Azoarcus sp. DN11]|uniref:hypothetical protein n=1 Tax=Azoarcus sp. DN11 TaxID=356837 RepID=UPI0013E3ECDF|nr:hypothetical protein [Azoarcus sp. DN11]